MSDTKDERAESNAPAQGDRESLDSPRSNHLDLVRSTDHPDAQGGAPPSAAQPIKRPIVVKITRTHLLVRWGLTALALVCFLAFYRVATPYCRSFSFTDESISHKHKPDTFPSWSLIVFTVTPVVISLILCYVAPVFPKIQWWEFHEMAYCGLLSAALNSMMTDPTVVYAGRLRPDFIDRLDIAGYNSSFPDPLTTDYCVIHDSIVNAGRLSFPSGHTSTAFSSMVLTTLILFNRFRTFHQPEWRVLYFFVGVTPLFFAFTVAVSRTRDNRHHFSDILGGALIGTMAAFMSFRLVFAYCGERLMFIPSLFVRSSGHGTSGTGGGAGSYRRDAADTTGEEDEELPPVVHEEMPVIA